MKEKMLAVTIVLICLLLVGQAMAAEVFKTDEIKDKDGKKVCVYKNGFDKIYTAPDQFNSCPMTIER